MTPAQRLLETLKSTPHVVAPHVGGALRAQIAAELMIRGEQVVLLGRDQTDAEAVYRDLAFMFGTNDERAVDEGIFFLGADDKNPYEEYSPDVRAVMERLGTLHHLAKEPESVRALILTPHALVRRFVPPSFFDQAGDYVMAGSDIDRDDLIRRLTDCGYNPVTTVEDPGTFSVRGGIIDIFSPQRSRPVRLDLFGDEVESIKLFDPETQRNGASVDDAVLLPVREIAFDKATVARAVKTIEQVADRYPIPSRHVNAVVDDIQNHIFFFGIEGLMPAFHEDGLVGIDRYLPPKAIYMQAEDEPLREFAEQYSDEAHLGYERAKTQHHIALPPESHLIDIEDGWDKAVADRRRVSTPEVAVGKQQTLELRFQSTDDLRGEILKATRRTADEQGDVMAPLVQRLRQWRGDRLTTFIACHTRGQAERLKELLAPKKLDVRLLQQPFSLSRFMDSRSPSEAQKKGLTTLRERSVHAWLVFGEVSGGFVLPDGHLALISEEEIFGQRMKRRKRRTAAASDFVTDLKDLTSGDFVVHVDFGVGQYHGLTKLAVNGVESDYLHIEYKGKDKLYLPVHRLRLISKYATTGDGRQPVLDKLGGTAWANTKRKVKDSLLKMAAELLRLYAMRQAVEGQALPAPDEVFRQFEAEFPFDPTPDQQTAIEDVIDDMQKHTPMDRLICGDVGYGKTEVAMRAAMMAVMGRKQVAVLVPTTVLAAQHYHTFSERFANYPVKLALVSRFQTKDQIKQALKEAKDGSIDILIGTHRLLSKDVAMNRLGLLIIDEEHRFGVRHKEALKKYRATVHVLALSATPIPRTLHMGFMGVRDMSMIATAPVDRLAVKTEVHRFSEDVIREAVLREIRRGGQCFIVHNRVSSIAAFANMLERLIPEARLGIGHGQMEEDRLEQVMVDFMNKKFNVLLATTIIESGIDIPNANTIIINRADRMGLAQLYQLRGRVGRSKTRGFAYFLIPAGNLSKKARARINVLQRFTELGAGFKVASKDLEIRGAGNLLGKAQSGTIAQVGFDMYQALLQEAIAELKGSERRSMREPEIQLPVTALIPDRYVKEPSARLQFYQRFNAADTDDAAYDVLQQVTDLYGNPPAEVENLAQLMLLKQRLWRLGAVGLDYGAQTKAMPPRIVVRFDDQSTGINPEQLVQYVQNDPRRRKMTPDGRLLVHLQPFEDVTEILAQAKDQLDDLQRLKHRASA